MNPKFRLLKNIIIIVFVGFLIMQPYKWFCNLTQKCQPISFSQLFPSKKGIQNLKFNFVITNYKKDLEIRVEQTTLTTLAGEKNVIKYYMKNNSKRTMRFHLKMHFEPEELEKYLIRHQCLCFSKYKLKGGEEKEVEMIFEIDSDIERDQKYRDRTQDEFTIRYEVKMI